jgi:uncharacterized membrane protein YphA (DoxX/SURF4 family)
VPTRYTISTATVVALVALRLVIGWHFFSEGAKHYGDSNWTSEPVLRGAKGPLAPMYRSYVPDFHGFDRWLHDEAQTPEHVVGGWIDEIQTDWDAHRQQLSLHHGLEGQALKKAAAIERDYQARLRAWAAANKEALLNHVHQWRRKESTGGRSDAEVPFTQKRVAEQQATLAGEANGWLAELRALESKYENDLAKLSPGNPPMPRDTLPIDVVDGTMTWLILTVGLLLLLGLFTPVACIAGALFLLSVVMMQPFWVEGAAPTFNQYVEMFALVALATTQVGRWAGLDFFLAQWFSRRSMKGTSDVSQS